MDPNDLSGGSDQEDSDMDQARPMGQIEDDSDDDNDGCDALRENGRVGQMTAGVDEDDDDDNDSREEAVAEPPPKPSPPPRNTMDQFVTKTSAVSTQKKSATSTKETTKPAKDKPAKSTNPSATRPNGASSKSKEPKHTQKPPPSTAQSDSDDEDGLASLTVPHKPTIPLPAPDPQQEYDNQRANIGTTAPEAPVASVHPSYNKLILLMKNEKVNKWYRVDSEALLYAPEWDPSGMFNYSSAELSVQGKKERETAQDLLMGEHGAKVSKTAVILGIETDGTGSGTGPGMTNVIMAIPYALKPVGTEMENARAKVDKMGGGGTQEEKWPIIGLLQLGPEVVKRAYAVHNNPLPARYDPNNNPTVKYKAYGKVEDMFKTATSDSIAHFQLLPDQGKIEQGNNKRKAQDKGDDAGGSSSSRAAASKRPANGVSTTEGATAATAPTEFTDHEDCPGQPTSVPQPQFAPGPPGAQITTLTCAADQKLTLLSSGVKGRYFLITTPE